MHTSRPSWIPAACAALLWLVPSGAAWAQARTQAPASDPVQVLAGRTPMEAIKSATSDNARWLGDKTIGSIENGKWADLVVLEKNPLDDIRNTHMIAQVYVAGNSVPTIWQTCRDRPAKACTAARRASVLRKRGTGMPLSTVTARSGRTMPDCTKRSQTC